MLLALDALAPAASAGPGALTIFVDATPDGAHINDTIDIIVRSYEWAAPADLDNLTGTVEIYNLRRIDLAFRWQAPGEYHASFMIAPDVDPRYAIRFNVHGERALEASEASKSYLIGFDRDWRAPGLRLVVRLANFDAIGYAPTPGADVVFEARTYFDGELEDRGMPTAEISQRPEAGPSPLGIRGTMVAAGVYRYPFHIPDELARSVTYRFSANLAHYTLTPSSTYELEVDPVPAAAILQELTPEFARVRVCAGWGDSPLENATVDLSAVINDYGMRRPVFAYEPNLSTGRLGCVDASLNLPGIPDIFIQITANVSAFGKTSNLYMPAVSLQRFSLGPEGPVGVGGFQVTSETDTADLAPGMLAHLSLLVTEEGRAVANASLATLVHREAVAGLEYPGTGEAPVIAANRTTDASGRLYLEYLVPDDWKPYDALRLVLFSPAGKRIDFATRLGALRTWLNVQSSDPALSLRALEDTPNGTVDFSAKYGGATQVTGTAFSVSVLPSETQHFFPVAVAGNFPRALVDAPHGSASGSVAMPGWLVEGAYVVWIGEDASASTLDPNYRPLLVNWTFVHLTPRASAPVDALGPIPDDGSGGHTPERPMAPYEAGGDISLVWLIAVGLAGTAGLTFAKHEWRRRHAL